MTKECKIGQNDNSTQSPVNRRFFTAFFLSILVSLGMWYLVIQSIQWLIQRIYN